LAGLPGFELFYCCAALFKEDAVAAVGTPDVDVDLHFLFAPCALVGTCHRENPVLLGFVFNDTGAVDGTEGNTEGGGLGLVCAAGELEPALPALPDAGAFALHRLRITLRAQVICTRDFLHLGDSLAHESSISAAKTPCATGYFSFCGFI
jgi:hypothetical protein